MLSYVALDMRHMHTSGKLRWRCRQCRNVLILRCQIRMRNVLKQYQSKTVYYWLCRVIYTEQGLCNGRASVHLFVTSIDNSNSGRWVCCWAPCDRRYRSIAAGTVLQARRRSAAMMRVTSRNCFSKMTHYSRLGAIQAVTYTLKVVVSKKLREIRHIVTTYHQ